MSHPLAPAGQLLCRADSVLVCIDLQERLMPVISGGVELVERTRRLLVGAHELKVPVFVTEQVPEKLGHTVPGLREAIVGAPVLAKATFSACPVSAAPNDPDACGLAEALQKSGRKQLVLVGVETHVCVLQTALSALAAGFAVFVVEDAVGSRDPALKANALRRIEQAGGVIVNHESVLFEWLERATAPAFRAISRLVK